MRAVGIDIMSATTEALRYECDRVGVTVTPGSAAPTLQQALSEYMNTAYKSYKEWVEWSEQLAIPGLSITDGTTLASLADAVCGYLYGRLVTEGYVHPEGKGKALHPIVDADDAYYITGRSTRESVSTVSIDPERTKQCALTYAAACAFEDVERAWWSMQQWENDNK